MKPMLNWFEIPARNIKRAIKFYETIFSWKIKYVEMGGLKMGWFPREGYNLTGSLVEHDGYIPSKTAALLYFNIGEDLQPYLNKVENAGGEIIQKKKQVSEEYGYMAVIIDTEGNRIALHSNN